MDEVLEQFVVEAAELTQQVADDLLALDRDPSNQARLDSVFRGIHTLKGSVGLFDFAPLHAVLHAAEDLLGQSKDSGETDPVLIDPLLAVVEWTERCVAAVRAEGVLPSDAPERSKELLARLGSVHAPAIAPLHLAASGQQPDWVTGLLGSVPPGTATDLVAIRYAPSPDAFFNGDDPLALMASVPGIVTAIVSPREPWPALQTLDPFRSNLIVEALSTAPLAEVKGLFRLVPDQVSIVPVRAEAAATPVPMVTAPATSRTVRVDVAKVDRLLSRVGELFTAKSAMTQLSEQAGRLPGGQSLARSLATLHDEIDRLAEHIQRAATDVRMVALDETLRRLPRLVREISTQTGKPVDLVITGGEIEADKAIVDALFDPLLHIVRNAVDHGIESDGPREAAGKPKRGTITVAARQTGFQIELDVIDDGRGVDLERVRQTAVSRGLLSGEAAAALSADDVHDLLFAPGFSTAEAVTDLSGRGVGMDAVRAAVGRLGGTVSIASRQGIGTTVGLSLPSSFALERLLVVRAGGERFAVSMGKIVETVRIPQRDVVQIRAGEAFVMRNRTTPLLRLTDLLGLARSGREEELVVIAEIAGLRTGLAVDAIGEQFQTMLRPPTGLLRAIPGISGATVLADGQVMMVLDLEQLLS